MKKVTCHLERRCGELQFDKGGSSSVAVWTPHGTTPPKYTVDIELRDVVDLFVSVVAPSEKAKVAKLKLVLQTEVAQKIQLLLTDHNQLGNRTLPNDSSEHNASVVLAFPSQTDRQQFVDTLLTWRSPNNGNTSSVLPTATKTEEPPVKKAKAETATDGSGGEAKVESTNLKFESSGKGEFATTMSTEERQRNQRWIMQNIELEKLHALLVDSRHDFLSDNSVENANDMADGLLTEAEFGELCAEARAEFFSNPSMQPQGAHHVHDVLHDLVNPATHQIRPITESVAADIFRQNRFLERAYRLRVKTEEDDRVFWDAVIRRTLFMDRTMLDHIEMTEEHDLAQPQTGAEKETLISSAKFRENTSQPAHRHGSRIEDECFSLWNFRSKRAMNRTEHVENSVIDVDRADWNAPVTLVDNLQNDDLVDPTLISISHQLNPRQQPEQLEHFPEQSPDYSVEDPFEKESDEWLKNEFHRCAKTLAAPSSLLHADDSALFSAAVKSVEESSTWIISSADGIAASAPHHGAAAHLELPQHPQHVPVAAPTRKEDHIRDLRTLHGLLRTFWLQFRGCLGNGTVLAKRERVCRLTELQGYIHRVASRLADHEGISVCPSWLPGCVLKIDEALNVVNESNSL